MSAASFQRRIDEAEEERVGRGRSALELRVELACDEVWVLRLRQFHDFHELAVWRDARDCQTGRNKRGPPVAVVGELVAVTVAFGYFRCCSQLCRQRTFGKGARICAEAHGAAFLRDAALVLH